MQYTVLLHRDSTGIYEATAPAVPGCTGTGKTRGEALKQLKNILYNWLETTEITTIDVDLPKSKPEQEQNPWLVTAGMFKDDPMLEPMLKEIYSLRAINESSE